jgi:uncharacterized protein (TIGR03643 family)
MRLPSLSTAQVNRIIEMAWEDRTPFEAIEFQFGMTEKHVILLMRREMKTPSFKLWRKRVSGRRTKHASRHPKEGSRFHCATQKQRIYGSRR